MSFFLDFGWYSTLCSVLGKGATGAVFQGVNKHNGETVAVRDWIDIGRERFTIYSYWPNNPIHLKCTKIVLCILTTGQAHEICISGEDIQPAVTHATARGSNEGVRGQFRSKPSYSVCKLKTLADPIVGAGEGEAREHCEAAGNRGGAGGAWKGGRVVM